MFRIIFGVWGQQINSIEVDAETFDDVENIALFECRQRLVSSKIMLDHVEDLTYDVLDGLELSGQVKIRAI